MSEAVSNPAPKRRWLRFSLRTLFIVMTVVACLMGWQGRIVAQRRIALRSLQAIRDGEIRIAHWNDDDSIGPIRSFMGDKPVCWIGLPETTNEDEIKRFVDLFPYAGISIGTGSSNSPRVRWIQRRSGEMLKHHP
jgi:hypothetical protein